MDKVKTFCFVLFYIILAMVVYFTGFDLMQVFAEDKVYNYLDLDSSSSNRQYYATITKLPSEQYDTYNWYFWEEEMEVSSRIELLVDYITSRSYTYISPNDIKYVANCKALFRGGLHTKDNLDSYNISNSSCRFTFFVSNNASLYLRGMHPYASSWSSSMLNGNDRANYINSGMTLNYFSCTSCKYVDLAYTLNSAFFTTPVADLDTWLANNVNLGSYFDRSGSGSSHSNTLGEERLYYNSINNWNLTKYPNYNYSNFLYHAPSDIITIENYTYPSTLTGSNLTTCRIINNKSTCDNDFTFIDYKTYKESGGVVNIDDSGLPNVNTGAGADYTEQLEDIIDSINYDGETSTIPDVDPSIINDTISNNNALLDNSNIQDFDFEDYSISGDLSDGITYVMYKVQILFVALPWYVDLVGVCLTLSIVAMLLNRK